MSFKFRSKQTMFLLTLYRLTLFQHQQHIQIIKENKTKQGVAMQTSNWSFGAATKGEARIYIVKSRLIIDIHIIDSIITWLLYVIYYLLFQLLSPLVISWVMNLHSWYHWHSKDRSMHKQKELDLTQKRPVDVLTQNVRMR